MVEERWGVVGVVLRTGFADRLLIVLVWAVVGQVTGLVCTFDDSGVVLPEEGDGGPSERL